MKGRWLLLGVYSLLAAMPSVRAEAGPRVCEPGALAALARFPPMPLQCRDSTQFCRSDVQSTLFDRRCADAVSSYEKTLRGLIRTQWWETPPEALEACRVHGKAGPLSQEEADSLGLGYGQEVQGDDRVRLLVVEKACDAPVISNVLLAVRADIGLVLTPLYFAFNQGGTEDPFSLAIVHNSRDTIALFTTDGHTMSIQYETTTAYRVDLTTGKAEPHPLFVTARGEQTSLETSRPIAADVDPQESEMIVNGRFRTFVNQTANLCADDAKDCAPVSKETFVWNGKAFVTEGLEAKRQEYLEALARQRQCLETTFNPRTGGTNCPIEFLCERENVLAGLSLKSGNLDQARARAASALDYCRGLVGGAATARETYRQIEQRR